MSNGTAGRRHATHSTQGTHATQNTQGIRSGPDPGEPSLRHLITLLDWMRERTQLARPSRTDDPLPTAAQSLLDGAAAVLGIHRPGALPDGTLYCAVCLGETGSRAWPCQTVRAFGLAVLRHWIAPAANPDRSESESTRHSLRHEETRGPRLPPWI
jgi:hypothetical protein